MVLHVSGSSGTGSWERAKVHLVSGNYFKVLGVSAAAGRLLIPSDDSPTASRAVVLSYPFWRDRFDSDPAVIGKTVVLNSTAFTIVGVAAREFFGDRVESAPEFWLPLAFQPEILQAESYRSARSVYWLNFFGRRKPGVSMASAQAAVNARFRQFNLAQAGTHVSADLRRKIESVRIQLKPGGGGISADRFLYSQPLHLLMAVVAVVLLIACANVATLLLARASARRPEFLTRLALGASRTRLLRQVLTESILLSFIGGALGVAVGWWSVKLLLLLLHLHPIMKVRLDPLVLAFTFALSIFTGIFFGIFPALKFSRMDPRPAVTGRWRVGSAQALIASQISLLLILLFSAGLLAHSLLALERQDIGFQRDNVLVVRTDAGLAGYKPPEFAQLYRDIGDRLSALPGVVSASIGRFTPVSGYSSSSNFSIEGYTPASGTKMRVYHLPVAPRFLETLNVPLLLGRTISARDTPASPPVAVVNQSFVNLYLPNQNPIGRHMTLGSPFKAPGVEIVGVVADSKFFDVREKAPPMAFFSLWQQPTSEAEAVLRTTAAPLGLAAEVRQAFKQISSKLPILGMNTLDSQIEKSLDQQKMVTKLCSIFGLLALLLVSVGIYGTLAYSVAGRTNEIGVRMAIGAQRRDVIWLILRDSLILAAVGVIAGLPLALAGTRWLKSFLYGQVTDPLAITFALLLIIALALFAGYLPTRRAARIDPMGALRHE